MLAAVLEDTEVVDLLAITTEDVEFCVEATIEAFAEVFCSPKNQDIATGEVFKDVLDKYCLVLNL